MKMPRIYASPETFKQALEQRLRSMSSSGADFARRRQLLVFDRFLARVVVTVGDAATLKGGLVLELRLARARTTKDIDLRMVGSPDRLLAQLQRAGRLDVGDFMRFEVMADADHPTLLNDGMRYDGLRHRVDCRLAGKPYGEPFGVDVAFGDPIFGEPDVLAPPDILAFAGIAPPALRLYPVETHIAEKLHAYTMPRRRPNTRVKDLPDLALLASTRSLDANRVRGALLQTFGFRETHALHRRDHRGPTSAIPTLQSAAAPNTRTSSATMWTPSRAASSVRLRCAGSSARSVTRVAPATRAVSTRRSAQVLASPRSPGVRTRKTRPRRLPGAGRRKTA